ncbi:MAG: hypothetical protein MO852_16640, partial [Candidatus Devosia euplotis]|nr:hypothetical protein [Candidatus Devosia euplotis]
AAQPDLRPAVAGGFVDAIAARRLFVLLPFIMIAGLMVYAALPIEPQAWALAGAGLALMELMILMRQSARLPLAVLLAALWVGICLLPVHGWRFGTPMLACPAYGTFRTHVDAVVSATEANRRVIVSGLTPLDGTRLAPIARGASGYAVATTPGVRRCGSS